MTLYRCQTIRSTCALLRAVLRWIGLGIGAWLIGGIAEATPSRPDVCSRAVQTRDAIVAASGALQVTGAEGLGAGDDVEVVVAASVQPLTARVEGLPERHDGEDSFRFRLYFSEEIRISYRTLRDAAFVVHGGTIRGANRLAPPSNVGWRITVRPASNAAVVLVLPGNIPCGDIGAICTADAKRLSNRLEITVPGPE